MSTATIKPNLKIEIDEAIRRDPKLLDIVQQAAVYLEELLEDPNLEADGRELSWSLTDKSPAAIFVQLAEWDHYGRRDARASISRKDFFERDYREIFMSKLVRQLLRQASSQIGVVIDRGIRELELAELNNGHGQ